MVFTTHIFIFIFFPICIAVYYLISWLSSLKLIGKALNKIRIKDIIIIIFSLGFYMWSSFDNVFRLIFYIFAVYILAVCIETLRKKRGYFKVYYDSENKTESSRRVYFSFIALIAAVGLIVFCLIYYNYSNLIITGWNKLFGDNVESASLIAPLGISFITFSAVSYLTDIYRGSDRGSIIDCFLYLSFFPKIISGPIVLWKDFNPQIKTRRISVDLVIGGINRIMTGFAKKVILADSFGNCLASISLQGIDRVTAAGTLILYMLQIYFDFSGYSDIALGISRLFGFEFKENFNFPYCSKSVSEFWRRWHISLGTWFREYVYIPLGGSRKGKKRTLINLAVVFAVTGIWHGAGLNYILWGAINGVCVVLERANSENRLYLKLPVWIKYIITMTIVMVFWQLFRYQDISEVGRVFGIIFGQIRFESIAYNWKYYFDAQMITFIVIGIIGSAIFGIPGIQRIYGHIKNNVVCCIIQEFVLLALFVTAILFMVNSTYSPFIYFQY